MIDYHRCSGCSASLTEEEKKRKDDENSVLSSSRFATLALISGDIDILVGLGSPQKRHVGA